MKKLRKVMCILLTGIFLAWTAVENTAMAGDTIKIQIGEKEGKEGERIKIPISISGNGAAGLDFVVVYDSRELEFVKAEKGDSANSGNLCDINHMKERSSIHYVYVNNKAIEKDGEVLALYFDVLNEEEKVHTVDVKVKKILDADIKELSYQVEGGRIISPPEGNASASGQTGVDSETDAAEGASNGGGTEAAGTDSRDTGPDGTSRQDKRRIVVKTKDGLKDVTEPAGKKTNENLLKAEEGQDKTSNRGVVIGGISIAGIVILSAGGYLLWKKRK